MGNMEVSFWMILPAAFCVAAFAVYSLHLFGIYGRFLFFRQEAKPYNHEPLSIIIAARDEAGNLRNHLPLWLAQERDELEIIVVNDGSLDETAAVLDAFAARDARLRVIHLPQSVGKKNALAAGIREAKHDLLLFTDADCRPASNRWASEMASCFTPGVQIVLGYGGYERKSGLLNRLIQMETGLTAARYVAWYLWKRPYMGVGRNLAYRKSFWRARGGFSGHEDLPFGDDDLFVLAHARAKETAVCLDPAAFTYSLPPDSWRDWFRQKKRHFKTAVRYPKGLKVFLASEFLSLYVFWLSGLVWVFQPSGIKFGLFLSFVLLYRCLIFNAVFKLLKIRISIFFIPFLSGILSVALFLQMISALFATRVSWKER
jgi:cellulose synthase/poly-beta-1,6-N-acetylglucosamine synthase-like glycosyltransferase